MPKPTRLRPPVPREHGSWAALLIPVLVAMLYVGVSGPGLLLVAAGLALLFARAALQARTEPPGAGWVWATAWTLLALALMLPLLLRPGGGLLLAVGVAAAGLELGATRLGRKTAVRSLAADVLAAAESGLILPAYVIVATATLSRAAMLGGFVVFLFWVQTAMRVRSQLRERSRPAFRGYSLAVHLASLAAAIGGAGAMGAALTPAVLHAAWLLGRPPRPESSLRIGLREIGQALLFVILLGFLGRST